jgi:hypothetical protein
VPQPLLMAPPLFSRIDTPTPFAFQDISGGWLATATGCQRCIRHYELEMA